MPPAVIIDLLSLFKIFG